MADRPFYYEANSLAKTLQLPSPPALARLLSGLRERGYAQKRGLQNGVPLLRRGWTQYRRCRSAGHFITIPEPIQQPERQHSFAQWPRSWALL